MKKIIFLILILFPTCDVSLKAAQDTIFYSLYKLMEQKDIYMAEKEERISEIKKLLKTPDITENQRYDINLKLYNEYKVYLSDSAIYYARENTVIANKLNHIVWINESKLDLVSLYIVSGMFIEATDILKSIKNKDVPDWLQIKYYDCNKKLYNHYSNNNPYTLVYLEKSQLYRDSLLNILNKESNHYRIVYAEKLYDEYQLHEAKEIIQKLLDQTESDTHEKAVLAYALANIYKKEGNISLQKYYYALSAVCDIKNAIKENASMQALASILYETGEIERAYNCIKSSMEDAIFCNARLRTYEISQIFPIIDSAYQENVNKQKSELQLLLILVSILSVFLIAAVIYVYKQMKKVTYIRKELYQTNIKLNNLNTELRTTINQVNTANKELSDVNIKLSEANLLKETYISQFLDICSMYINKLEKYQNELNKKAKDRKLEELYKMLKSKDMIAEELKNLYEMFDNIFLHLYPNFLDDFNALLQENERIDLKPNELLTPELRIFALIRLGITDSSKIAGFLHYSATTIYNYRTRMRNKSAVPREEFENMVRKIGIIQCD